MSRKFLDNSDNEEENSFQKEYLNIFNNDFLEDDEGDDDYNVVEDILTHRYNYDDKPYYLSIPKKEVNDLINDANLQDNLDIFSDEDNEYRFLSRKTHRNKDNKDKKNNNINNLNNKQLSNFSNSLILENKNNSNLKSINFNKQLSNFSNISAIHKKNNEEEKINLEDNKMKLNSNKLSANPHLQLKDSKEHSKNKKSHKPKNNYLNNILQNSPIENNNFINNQNYFNNANNNFLANSINNNFNNFGYDYLSQIKDINQNKCLEQMDIIEKLLFLLKQYDFMLQLLIQNLMMTDNKNLKFRCYTLLFSFYMAKQRVIENLKFPEFHVSFEFNDIFKSQNQINIFNNPNPFSYKYQKLRLQLSFFQPPILEILPLLVNFIIKRTFTREETIKILKDLFPFTNPLYFPISKKFRHSTYIINCNNNISANNNNNANNDANINSNDNNDNNDQNPKKKKMRKKFNYVDDSLLLLGIYFHGKKNYDVIKQLWLPGRSTEEIKHRIKNLVCQNAPINIIKKYKTMNENPLNAKDFLKFLKGIQWFGLKNKWNLISRYFLPEKTSDYLENFFELLVEKHVLPSDLCGDNYKNNGIKNKNGNLKKVNIFMDDEVIKMYKENFKEEIEKIKNEINNINGKNIFFSDVEYEKLDKEFFIKNKDDTKINTRNKSKKNLNNNINEANNEKGDDKKNKNNDEIKNNGIKNIKDNANNLQVNNEDLEFQMNFLDNELFEKITI